MEEMTKPMTDEELIEQVRKEAKGFNDNGFIVIGHVQEWLPALCDRLEAANKRCAEFKDGYMLTQYRAGNFEYVNLDGSPQRCECSINTPCNSAKICNFCHKQRI